MNGELHAAIAKLIDDGAAPGGAVSLLAPGSPPSSIAHGYFAGADSSLVTADTTYDLASVTKLFTAALVLRLHEQGRLSIYDRCSKYLDNFQQSEVRIIDLLTHRLGIDLSLAQFSATFNNTETFREALLKLEVPKQPTNHIAYANLQLFYAGVVVERITGHSLQDALHQLFTELGLTHTFTSPDIVEKHISVPPTEIIDNTVIQGVTHDESSRKLGGIAGYAGVFASAADLAQFGQAWLDGRIVSRDTLNGIVFKDYDPAGTTPQAFGWWLRYKDFTDTVVATPGLYSHAGFTGSLLAIHPESGRVAAFTCNRTYYGRNNRLQRHIWELLITWLQPEHSDAQRG